jgi:hypothetical protein
MQQKSAKNNKLYKFIFELNRRARLECTHKKKCYAKNAISGQLMKEVLPGALLE